MLERKRNKKVKSKKRVQPKQVKLAKKRRAKKLASKRLGHNRAAKGSSTGVISLKKKKQSDREWLKERGMKWSEDLYEELGDTQFLVNNMIPKGHLSMIAGPKGSGKTTLALEAFVKPIVNGHDVFWINNEPMNEESPVVLWIDTESYAQEVVGHAHRQGWPSSTLVVKDDFAADIDLSTPKFREFVAEFVQRFNSPLVVIDSLSGGHNKQEADEHMRNICRPLADLAKELQVAMLLIHHTRKLNGRDMTVDDIRGATAIIQFCRSIGGFFGKNKIFKYLCGNVIRGEKWNMTIDQNPLDQSLSVGAPVKVIENKTPKQKAKEFLMEQMEPGESHVPKELIALAEDEGIAPATLRRAANEICITKHRSWMIDN